ncbi:uncharacterized protein MONBRDRAFT_38527 [Monosiga brevicollis MX1]|uniref:Uncharacterized protein n=1 Tax=Monosiga brevicollis TaxID=81824 RepID=A9V8H8_MONBE|nr:uncharacterized protein MONBRDRAFT_38527 [Monosiga brevicollis MX1]EDQ86085.1 predicted protein [Monosiga brevicollis MX1]|eukprot:XP_001749010.1 hypothetical protein [Monosiga brevicollis MX1]
MHAARRWLPCSCSVICTAGRGWTEPSQGDLQYIRSRAALHHTLKSGRGTDLPIVTDLSSIPHSPAFADPPNAARSRAATGLHRSTSARHASRRLSLAEAAGSSASSNSQRRPSPNSARRVAASFHGQRSPDSPPTRPAGPPSKSTPVARDTPDAMADQAPVAPPRARAPNPRLRAALAQALSVSKPGSGTATGSAPTSASAPASRRPPGTTPVQRTSASAAPQSRPAQTARPGPAANVQPVNPAPKAHTTAGRARQDPAHEGSPAPPQRQRAGSRVHAAMAQALASVQPAGPNAGRPTGASAPQNRASMGHAASPRPLLNNSGAVSPPSQAPPPNHMPTSVPSRPSQTSTAGPSNPALGRSHDGRAVVPPRAQPPSTSPSPAEQHVSTTPTSAPLPQRASAVDKADDTPPLSVHASIAPPSPRTPAIEGATLSPAEPTTPAEAPKVAVPTTTEVVETAKGAETAKTLELTAAAELSEPAEVETSVPQGVPSKLGAFRREPAFGSSLSVASADDILRERATSFRATEVQTGAAASTINLEQSREVAVAAVRPGMVGFELRVALVHLLGSLQRGETRLLEAVVGDDTATVHVQITGVDPQQLLPGVRLSLNHCRSRLLGDRLVIIAGQATLAARDHRSVSSSSTHNDAGRPNVSGLNVWSYPAVLG